MCPEEEDYLGHFPPEDCLGDGCSSKVKASSSEVDKTYLTPKWTQEKALFQAVEVLGEGV